MPYMPRTGARVFFDDLGSGEPIVTIHGFSENGGYWSIPGVSSALAEAGYRVIDMDMRGHGRSVTDSPEADYAVDTIATDIGALADHLGLDTFHLLSHATGGMAALRYAMRNSDRLLSLISTDTSSATVPLDRYCDPEWDNQAVPQDDADIPDVGTYNEDTVRAYPSAHASVAALRSNPEQHFQGPFMSRYPHNPDPDRCWRWTEQLFAINNPETLVEFARTYYTDQDCAAHDPLTAELRKIKCPNLVMVGEYDIFMRKAAEQLQRNIPVAQLRVLENLGHMIAIEAPERVAKEIITFMNGLPSRNSARAMDQ